MDSSEGHQQEMKSIDIAQISHPLLWKGKVVLITKGKVLLLVELQAI